MATLDLELQAPRTVVAVFDTHERAMGAVDELRRSGFTADDISVFAPDPREIEGFADELGIRVLQSSGAGAVLGGLLTAAAVLLVPGIGAVVAAGPVAGALLGAIGGGALGGFVGTFVGLGMPRHAAEEYARELRQRRTLVFVHADERHPDAEAALWRAHPVGLHHYDESLARELQPERAVAKPSHDALHNPTEHVEPAAPDRSRTPADVAGAIEGQEVLGHTQWLDEADLHHQGGTKAT